MALDRRTLIAAAALAPIAGRAEAARSTGKAAGLPALPVLPPAADSGVTFDPRSFGAKADGRTKDTAAVQQALDRCAVLGGGTVMLAGGTFLVGALRMGSHCRLHLTADAVLQGSDDLADYPVTQVRWEGRWVAGHIGLIFAQSARNVRLEGKGLIRASHAIPGRVGAAGLRHPALLEWVDVQGLSMTGLRTEQNDMWSIHPVYCEDVLFRDLTVHGGADGIDVDSCRRVLIERCSFDTVDDCISLKSGRGLEGETLARPTEDVTVRDCSFIDHRWACIGVGSETSGGIRRLLVERCRFLKAHTFSIYIKSRPGRGAFIKDIVMRDLEVKGAGDGFLRLNLLDSGKQDPFPVPGTAGIPTVRDIRIENVRIDHVPTLVQAVNIHPDKPVERFTLRNIRGSSDQGMVLANMRDVRIEKVDVAVRTGPRLAVANVQGRGLEGAAALPPTPRPPDVQGPAHYRLGMGSGAPV